MSVLTNGDWKAPFWGAEKTFITGQDMLGMQNTSIATYATLLPGLTNLTSRMRYYGFYTWMLEQYAKRKGKVSVAEFQRFMRRGELILAFVMSYKYPDELGVVGISYAKNYLNEHNKIIEIANGADRDTGHHTYWKYSSGAFGQYYHGALVAIGLIASSEREKRISVCTRELGRKLSSHFENTISEEIRERYINAIEVGKATHEDMEAFAQEFTLTGIEPATEEWKFYIELLFGQDYPTVNTPAGQSTFRRETILLYLEYLTDSSLKTPEDQFPESFYLRKWKDIPFVDTYWGWYFYMLNEYAHYSMETVLWAVLVELSNKGQSRLQAFVSFFTESTYSAFGPDVCHVDITTTMSFETFSEKLYQKEFQPSKHTKTIKNNGQDVAFKSVAHAMCIIGLMFQHEKECFERLRSNSRKHGMNRDGDVVQLLEWIDEHKKKNISDFMELLLHQKIINRHIEVAMRKMRHRNENTLKFQFEDNMLKPVGIVEPGWTGPRISSLHQFLVDLKLVDNTKKVTALGEKVLKEKRQ
jgi:hypothetical protein